MAKGLPDDLLTGGSEIPSMICNRELGYWQAVREPKEITVTTKDGGIEFVLAQAAANADKPDYLRALMDIARAAGRVEVAESIAAMASLSQEVEGEQSRENAPAPPCTPGRKNVMVYGYGPTGEMSEWELQLHREQGGYMAQPTYMFSAT